MIVGIMRVKNEARWIYRCVSSILPVCDQVIIMDDHSTDDTPEICATLHEKVHLLPSPFTWLNEVRDKNWLLGQAVSEGADWVVSIDGDEMLAPGGAEKLLCAMREETVPCLSLRVLYLWGSEDLVRVDGVYGDFHRESVFRPDGKNKFLATSHGGNFHCGNVPAGIREKRKIVGGATLLHFGYMHREDRVRKFYWYNEQDPGNVREDGYKHIVVGDLFPMESRFSYGGPLRVEKL
jgi:O-antigen biosynthesis protein